MKQVCFLWTEAVFVGFANYFGTEPMLLPYLSKKYQLTMFWNVLLQLEQINVLYFDIITYQPSLKRLQQMKDANGCLIQRALNLQHHDLLNVHLAGGIHQNFNSLFCLPHIDFLSPEDNWSLNIIGCPGLCA